MKTAISPTGRKPLNHLGFTLFEVLVTLLILSVFMMVAFPRIEAILPEGSLRLAARTIIGEISWTRGMAVSSHRDWILEFNETDHTLGCYVVEDERAGLESNPTRKAQRRKVRLPHGVALREVVVSSRPSMVEGVSKVRFYANGTLDPLVIYIANEQNDAFRMEVNPLTGEVRLHDRELQR